MIHNPERSAEFIIEFFKVTPDAASPEVWKTFAEITTIPRPSGAESRIADYLAEQGRTWNFETRRDAADNILLVSPPTKGYENAPAILLQAHSDMVPEKLPEAVYDPSVDGVRPVVLDSEWIGADGTTLGADNGIGISLGLQLLKDKKIKRGKLGLLVTTDEERGLVGAGKLEHDLSDYKFMINLDSEEEGEVTIGCAGAGYTDIEMELDTQPMRTGESADITISGLLGGHSGLEIARGGANGIKVLAGILKAAPSELGLRLVSFSGGNVEKMIKNAIPASATATVAVGVRQSDSLRTYLEQAATAYRQSLADFEKDTFSLTMADTVSTPERKLTQVSTAEVLDILTQLPHGVYETRDGNIITSTNLALVTIRDGKAVASMMSRSAVSKSLESMMREIEKIRVLNPIASPVHLSTHAGWEPVFDSEFIRTSGVIYERLTGKGLRQSVTHGGLECGVIGDKFPHFVGNMISVGPTILDAHKTSERLHVPSVGRTYDYVAALIGHLSSPE